MGFNWYVWQGQYCPFYDWKGNDNYLRVIKAMIPSLYITYFLFPTIGSHFQKIIFAFTLLMIWWLMNYVHLKNVEDCRKEYKCRRVFPGKITSSVPRPDQVILKEIGFRLCKKEIGFGTYGTTFLCGHNDKADNELAVKIIDMTEWLKNRYAKDPSQLVAKLEEIRKDFLPVERTLQALDHQNVIKYVRIHHEAQNFSKLYFIMPLAEMNLDDFLTKVKPNGVSEDWTRHWTRQLCAGLNYLHNVVDIVKPIAHSNLKPENILLFPGPKYKIIPTRLSLFSREDTEQNYLKDWFILKLTDPGFESFMPFGGKVVTKRNPSVNISPPDKVVGRGPLRYMTCNTHEYDKPSDDIYSLGVIILLLMNGDIHNLIETPINVDYYRANITGVDSYFVKFNEIKTFDQLPKADQMSKHVKHLLIGMLKYHSPLRFSLTNVMEHPWFGQNDQSL